MANEQYAGWLKEMKQMFERSTAALEDADSGFAPVEGMYTVAQQVAQVAQTLDWFVEGGFKDKGFDMDFEKLERSVRAVESLAEARLELDQAFDRAIKTVSAMSEEKMNEPMPPGPMMGGMPRYTLLSAICDHTAHHRGSLAVYTRLLGKVPPMPYGEE